MEAPYLDFEQRLAALAAAQERGTALRNDFTLLQLEIEEYFDHRAKGLLMGEECYAVEQQLDARLAQLAEALGPPEATEEHTGDHGEESPEVGHSGSAPPWESTPRSPQKVPFEDLPDRSASDILPPAPKAAPPLERILFLGASPMDRPRISLGRQVREISESLRRARLGSRFEFMFHQAVTPQTFTRHLLDQEEVPRYVHFAGFALDQDPQLGSGLVLESEQGETQVVLDTALPGLFQLFKPVDCLLINAAFSGAAARASAEVVEYVIGIDGDWHDQAAILFATGFYDALGAGRSIEDAVDLGRSALLLANIEQAAQLSVQPFLIVNVDG